MPTPSPDPLEDPQAVFDTITALANSDPIDWRAIAKFLTDLGWKLDRSGRLPDVIARKKFNPGPEVAAYVPQAHLPPFVRGVPRELKLTQVIGRSGLDGGY